jgi:DNA-directed RNA polymerase subunit RPC12/RpoP
LAGALPFDTLSAGRHYWESVVSKADVSRYECSNCGAKYKLVRAEADPKMLDHQITCRSCGAPLQGHEGPLALKYFLVDRPRVRASVVRFG